MTTDNVRAGRTVLVCPGHPALGRPHRSTGMAMETKEGSVDKSIEPEDAAEVSRRSALVVIHRSQVATAPYGRSYSFGVRLEPQEP